MSTPPPLPDPQTTKLTPPQWAWICLPLILIFIGGAIGGACGGGAFAVNRMVFLKTEKPALKYVWTGLISAGAFLLFLLLATAFHLLLRKHR